MTITLKKIYSYCNADDKVVSFIWKGITTYTAIIHPVFNSSLIMGGSVLGFAKLYPKNPITIFRIN